MQRGNDTRQQLLTAAVRVFGARGYDAVSTRELAAAAGANQAAILYHFGGKEGLYTAAAAHLAERGRAALAGVLARAEGPAPDPGAARAQLAAVLGAAVRGLLALADDGAAARFIAREQMQPGPGFAPLYDGYIGPLHAAVTRLVAAATAQPEAAPAVVVDAHALLGMALGFVVARETLLRRAGWPAYTPERVDAVAAAVADLARRALDPASSPPSAPAILL